MAAKKKKKTAAKIKAAYDSRPSDQERKFIKDAMKKKKKKAPKSKMSAHMRDMMADKAYGSGVDTKGAMKSVKKGIKKAKKRKVQKAVDRIVGGAKKTIKSRSRRP
jgi:hypothetical protein